MATKDFRPPPGLPHPPQGVQPTVSLRSDGTKLKEVVVPGVYSVRRIAQSYYPHTDFYSYCRDGELVFVLEAYRSHTNIDDGMLYGRDPLNLNRILFYAKYYFSLLNEFCRDCEVTEVWPPEYYVGRINKHCTTDERNRLICFLFKSGHLQSIDTKSESQSTAHRHICGKLFLSPNYPNEGVADMTLQVDMRESLFATVITRFWFNSFNVTLSIMKGPCPTFRFSPELKEIVQKIHNSLDTRHKMADGVVNLHGDFPVLPFDQWNAMRGLINMNIREIAQSPNTKICHSLVEDNTGKQVLLISKDNVKKRTTVKDLQSNSDILVSEASAFSDQEEIFLTSSNKTLLGSFDTAGYILDNENNRLIKIFGELFKGCSCYNTYTFFDFRCLEMGNNPTIAKMQHAMSRHNDECSQLIFDNNLDVRLKALIIFYASKQRSRHLFSCKGVLPVVKTLVDQEGLSALLEQINLTG